MNEGDCTHEQKVKYRNKYFCKKCGLFLIHSRIYKLHQYRMDYDPFVYIEKGLQSWVYQHEFENRSQTLSKMKHWVIKLGLSYHTLFLAMHYLDKVNPGREDALLHSLAALMIAGNLS